MAVSTLFVENVTCAEVMSASFVVTETNMSGIGVVYVSFQNQLTTGGLCDEQLIHFTLRAGGGLIAMQAAFLFGGPDGLEAHPP